MYESERKARAAFDHWKESLEPGSKLVLCCESLGGRVHYHVQHYSSKERAEYERIISGTQFDIVETAAGPELDTGAKICPICGKSYTGFPAISRKDNTTEICPACGTREALEAFEKYQNENERKRNF